MVDALCSLSSRFAVFPLSSDAEIRYNSEKAHEGDDMAQHVTKDFFISSNRTDLAWTEWMA
jgi:hypothetical protein